MQVEICGSTTALACVSCLVLLVINCSYGLLQPNRASEECHGLAVIKLLVIVVACLLERRLVPWGLPDIDSVAKAALMVFSLGTCTASQTSADHLFCPLISSGVEPAETLQTSGSTLVGVKSTVKSTPETRFGYGQVVVQLAVDKSRSVCLSVAHGEVDVAIIGGHVPEDLKDVLQVRQTLSLPCCSIDEAFQALCLKYRQSFDVNAQAITLSVRGSCSHFTCSSEQSKGERMLPQ